MAPFRNDPFRTTIDLVRECPRCQRDATMVCVEVAWPHGLRYSESTHCEHCGLRQEVDGLFASRDVRTRILERDGAWEARIEDAGPNRASVVKHLREESKLSVAEAAKASKGAGHVLDTGTRAEMEVIAAALRGLGASVSIEKAEPARVERALVSAVLRGDFQRAEWRYDEIMRSPQRRGIGARDAGLTFESKAGALDHMLTSIGIEGAKGPWSIVKDERVLVLGFDEAFVVAPRLSNEERAAIAEWIV